MDATILNEISLLEANKNKIDRSAVYNLMIHSIKGKYVCEDERKKFVLNRVISIDKLHPKFIEPHAEAFIDCYANLVRHTKENCSDKFNKIQTCLMENYGKTNDFPVNCVPHMEDFINC